LKPSAISFAARIYSLSLVANMDECAAATPEQSRVLRHAIKRAREDLEFLRLNWRELTTLQACLDVAAECMT